MIVVFACVLGCGAVSHMSSRQRFRTTGKCPASNIQSCRMTRTVLISCPSDAMLLLRKSSQALVWDEGLLPRKIHWQAPNGQKWFEKIMIYQTARSTNGVRDAFRWPETASFPMAINGFGTFKWPQMAWEAGFTQFRL